MECTVGQTFVSSMEGEHLQAKELYPHPNRSRPVDVATIRRPSGSVPGARRSRNRRNRRRQGAVPDRSLPREQERATEAMAASLTVEGSPFETSTLAAQPWRQAVVSTISRAASRSGSRSSGFSARRVPPASATSGMTLSAEPAWICPTLRTPGCVGSSLRPASAWSATTMWERARMGSRVLWG
jgi:hypothetical protein